jgi:dihydrofolate reductase
MKKVTIVAAMARNGAIGLDGRMPWHLPAELGHFKKATWGKPIVMGRKTYESIGKALPGRQNIVVTRSKRFAAQGCDIAHSLKAAIQIAHGEEVMVIGGGQLYRKAMPIADRLIITEVNCEPEADTWFPEWDVNQWEEVRQESFPADEKNPHSFSITEYLKAPAD